VFRGDAVENEVRLSGGPVRIGRHTGNDVVLDDSLNGVSRFHAEIRPEGNSYVIVDLNSRNGVWIGGRRIKDKAALLLGVPVTVGAFELALEDDPSGTFDGPVASPRTVASGVAVSDTGSSASRSGAPVSASRSTPRARAATPMSAKNRQILMWSGAAVGVLALLVVTYVVMRNKPSPPPPQVAVVEPTTTTTAPPADPPAAPPEDPNKALNEQDLQAARDMIVAGNYTGAVREHLQPLLERDPENAAALDMKRQAEEANAAARAKARATVVTPPPPPEPETPGIIRKAGEAYPEYTARVKGIQVNLNEGKISLDKNEYAVALARFRLVERDAPKYQGVDALIADASTKQQAAVDKAIDSGQQNETAGNLMVARRWYEQALQYNPSSVVAREKRAAVMLKMNQAAAEIYNQATAALKTQNIPLAKRLFQEVFDKTLPGDEYREKASKQLELMK
jgi:hypothetical protein